MTLHIHSFALLLVLCSVVAGCGDDDDAVEADRLGVGAECTEDADCLAPAVCLLQFKGGYCGIEDCSSNTDCPQGAVCVAHDDGNDYCFRGCVDKAQCNANRSPESESNCSSNVEFVDADTTGKACVPPSD